MKALVGAFNQEKALVGAFSVIVQPVVEPMDRFAALLSSQDHSSSDTPADTHILNGEIKQWKLAMSWRFFCILSSSPVSAPTRERPSLTRH